MKKPFFLLLGFSEKENSALINYFKKKEVNIHLCNQVDNIYRVLKSKHIVMSMVHQDFLKQQKISPQLLLQLLKLGSQELVLMYGNQEQHKWVREDLVQEIIDINLPLEIQLNEPLFYWESCLVIEKEKEALIPKTEKKQLALEESIVVKNRKIGALYVQVLEYKSQIRYLWNEWIDIEKEQRDNFKSFDNLLKEVKRYTLSDWDDFVEHFIEIHPSFFEEVQRRYPNLSQANLKMCAYIKIAVFLVL